LSPLTQSFKKSGVTDMSDKRGMGIFTSYETAETALIQLESTGFMMDRVSLIGRDLNKKVEVTGAKTSENLTGLNDTAGTIDAGETAKNGAIAGTAFGGVTGLLVGLGALAIPGVGPVMLAGAAATALATAASGSAIGAAAGSLAGGLVGLNIPEDSANIYSDRVAQGDYFVMIEGSDAELNRAEEIFKRAGIHEWSTHNFGGRQATPITTQYLEH
jgi:hypothetical protein